MPPPPPPPVPSIRMQEIVGSQVWARQFGTGTDGAGRSSDEWQRRKKKRKKNAPPDLGKLQNERLRGVACRSGGVVAVHRLEKSREGSRKGLRWVAETKWTGRRRKLWTI